MKRIIACILCLCLVLPFCAAFGEERDSILARFPFGMPYDEAYALIDGLYMKGTIELIDESSQYGKHYIIILLPREEYGITGPFQLTFIDDSLTDIAACSVYQKPSDGSEETAVIPEDYISYDALSEKLRGMLGDPAYTSQEGTKADNDAAITESLDRWRDDGYPYAHRDVLRYEQWITEGPDGVKMLINHVEYDYEMRESYYTGSDQIYTVKHSAHEHDLQLLPQPSSAE